MSYLSVGLSLMRIMSVELGGRLGPERGCGWRLLWVAVEHGVVREGVGRRPG